MSSAAGFSVKATTPIHSGYVIDMVEAEMCDPDGGVDDARPGRREGGAGPVEQVPAGGRAHRLRDVLEREPDGPGRELLGEGRGAHAPGEGRCGVAAGSPNAPAATNAAAPKAGEPAKPATTPPASTDKKN